MASSSPPYSHGNNRGPPRGNFQTQTRDWTVQGEYQQQQQQQQQQQKQQQVTGYPRYSALDSIAPPPPPPLPPQPIYPQQHNQFQQNHVQQSIYYPPQQPQVPVAAWNQYSVPPPPPPPPPLSLSLPPPPPPPPPPPLATGQLKSTSDVTDNPKYFTRSHELKENASREQEHPSAPITEKHQAAIQAFDKNDNKRLVEVAMSMSLEEIKRSFPHNEMYRDLRRKLLSLHSQAIDAKTKGKNVSLPDSTDKLKAPIEEKHTSLQAAEDKQLLEIATSMSLEQIKKRFPADGTDPSLRRKVMDLHLQTIVAKKKGGDVSSLQIDMKDEENLLELATSMTGREIRKTFKSKRNRGLRRILYELKRGVKDEAPSDGRKQKRQKTQTAKKKLPKTKPAWKEYNKEKQRPDLLKEDDSDDSDYVEHEVDKPHDNE